MELKGILKAIKLNESTISTILGAIVVVVVGILVINYFKGLRTETGVTTNNSAESQKVALPAQHTVVQGENLWQVSEKYYNSGYNWVDIAKENKLINADKLLVGQQLNIPNVEPKVVKQASQQEANQTISGNSYSVVKGDHLWGIAVRAYGDGYQWVKIAKENKLKNPNLLFVGTELMLPR